MKKLPPLFAEALVGSVKSIVLKCAELGLRCANPPCATTPLLRSLGYNEYQVRRFWSFFEDIGSLRIEIYHYHAAHFYLTLNYEKETIMYLEENHIPLDDLDCQRMGSRCLKVPHSHALYMYLEGGVGGAFTHANAIRILALSYLKNPRLVEELLNKIRHVIWRQEEIQELYDVVLKILLENIGILKYILPLIPNTKEKLLKLSPFLRRIGYRKT